MAPVSVTDQVQELSCSQSESTHYIANFTNSPQTIQVIEPSHKNSNWNRNIQKWVLSEFSLHIHTKTELKTNQIDEPLTRINCMFNWAILRDTKPYPVQWTTQFDWWENNHRFCKLLKLCNHQTPSILDSAGMRGKHRHNQGGGSATSIKQDLCRQVESGSCAGWQMPTTSPYCTCTPAWSPSSFCV